MPRDVVVVANKWWKVALLVAVLQNTDARPAEITDLARPGGAGPSAPLPRLLAACRGRQVAVGVSKT